VSPSAAAVCITLTALVSLIASVSAAAVAGPLSVIGLGLGYGPVFLIAFAATMLGALAIAPIRKVR
jgi:hypothetical protein